MAMEIKLYKSFIKISKLQFCNCTDDQMNGLQPKNCNKCFEECIHCGLTVCCDAR